MHSLAKRAAVVALLGTASALNGIVAPSQVTAGQEIEVTFLNANDDQYRVYLAAALAGSNGPTCYLVNTTTLSDSLDVSIPAGVGPSADYYSIAIADITSGQGATYSNRFNLTGATGEYSEYENHLGGSPFWSADDLPCSAYSCARQCAQASYPEDLTETTDYNTMKTCILNCDGVTPAASQTAPAHASTTPTPSATVFTGDMAIVTIGSSVFTAIETENVVNGKTFTEAVLGGVTLTLGGASQTVESEGVSLATDGVEVGGSTTVKFTSMTATFSGVATTTVDNAVTETTGSSASERQKFMPGAVAAGLAGLAFVL